MLSITALIFAFTPKFFWSNQGNNNYMPPEDKKGIVVLFPKENEVVSSPLKISGYVNGDDWIGFEGQVGTVKLFDDNDKELGMAVLTTKGEWMSRPQDDRGSSTVSGQVKIDFETNLWFDYPGEGSGQLVFYNENPSGEAEKNKTFTLPVKLSKSSSEKITVKAYFNNYSLDPKYSCDTVFPVDRDVPKTPAVAKAALEELLQGPTNSEKNEQYFTSVNKGVMIQSLSIENDVAKADFNSKLEYKAGGLCRVSAIRAQITETLKQFPTVKSVVISIDGRVEDILQP